jgi:hypothetical protein
LRIKEQEKRLTLNEHDDDDDDDDNTLGKCVTILEEVGLIKECFLIAFSYHSTSIANNPLTVGLIKVIPKKQKGSEKLQKLSNSFPLILNNLQNGSRPITKFHPIITLHQGTRQYVRANSTADALVIEERITHDRECLFCTPSGSS